MKLLKFAATLAMALAAAGCGALGERTWVAQGPGDHPEVVKAKREAQRPAPARTAQAPRGATRTPAAGGVPAPVSTLGGYTQATRYGDLLFVSGQIGIDHGSNQMRGTNIQDQTRQVMENLRAILESHRLTMANVVSATVYLKDIKDFGAMDEVYETYFRSNLPSRSVVEVSQLPRGALVEISVIAGR